MTEQKKSALTAGTVIGAKETYQKQFTPNSGKTQVPKIKYPMNPDMVITALEMESGQKMDSHSKELWKLMAILANDAYEHGRREETYSADWVKGWKTYFGLEPNPQMKKILELIDQFMTKSYEAGQI
jgi:hypothetical protein